MCHPSILVADSDTAVATCIAEALTDAGYNVHCHSGARLTLDMIDQLQPDLMLIEQRHTFADVAQLVTQLHQRQTAKPVAVVVSSTDARQLSEDAVSLRRYGCRILIKPFDLEQLLDGVAGALDDR